MLSAQIADLLKSARKALGLTQKELAARAGVSHRLWAEVERGERPHVSLETALRLLAEVGVTVRLTDPLGTSHELNASTTAARAARAAVRRATWQGRQIRLSQEGQEVDDGPTSAPGADRLAAVALVSEQAFAVAGGQRIPAEEPVEGATARAAVQSARRSAKRSAMRADDDKR